MNTYQSNKLLSRITFITGLGDFLSHFAILSILFKSTTSDLKSADINRIEVVAVLLSGLIIAKLISNYGARSLVVQSQVVSFFVSLFVLLSFNLKAGIWTYYIFYLIMKISEEVFKASREVASKSIATLPSEHRSLLAQLFQGFYAAQFVGPLLSVSILKFFPIELPLLLDSLSFLLCSFLATKLPKSFEIIEMKKSFFKSLVHPIHSILENKKLKKIFILRSIGHAVPIGLFNFTVYLVVSSKFNRDIIETAFISSATGLGGFISGTILKEKKLIRDDFNNKYISFAALLLMGGFELWFVNTNNFYLAIFINFLIGLCMAANGIASQSIRRNLTTTKQFHEVVGLEIFVSKCVELLSASLIAFLIFNNLVSKEFGITLASISLIFVGFLYLSKDLDVE